MIANAAHAGPASAVSISISITRISVDRIPERALNKLQVMVTEMIMSQRAVPASHIFWEHPGHTEMRSEEARRTEVTTYTFVCISEKCPFSSAHTLACPRGLPGNCLSQRKLKENASINTSTWSCGASGRLVRVEFRFPKASSFPSSSTIKGTLCYFLLGIVLCVVSGSLLRRWCSVQVLCSRHFFTTSKDPVTFLSDFTDSARNHRSSLFS